jgi:hypothetical protein
MPIEQVRLVDTRLGEPLNGMSVRQAHAKVRS